MSLSRFLFAVIGSACLLIGAYVGYQWYANNYLRSNRIERTLAIIKPDAIAAHYAGKIIDRIEQEGFTIIDLRKVSLDREQAEKFYAAHQDKPFFHQLVDYMASGPIMVMVIEKLNAISAWRDLIGATDPKDAKEGTLRKQFGTDAGRNAVHGSDSAEAAAKEISFFFADRNKA